MPAFSVDLADWFHDHHGIASGVDLHTLGLSRRQRQALLDEGILVVLHESVYRLAAVPLDFEARCLAACAADSSVVLTCHTAGTLRGWRKCGCDKLHLDTARVTKPIQSGVVVHRTSKLEDVDIETRADGIRLTTPARAFFDLARHVDDLTLRSIGEQIIARGDGTFDDLLETTTRLAHPNRPGSRRAIRVLATRNHEGSAADSHDEVVLFDALRMAGISGLVRHPRVVLHDGRVVHPDMGVPSLRFYVEVDHPTWHDSAATEYDKFRDTQVRRGGGHVERVSTDRVRTHLPRVIVDLLDVYHQRLRASGADTPAGVA